MDADKKLSSLFEETRLEPEDQSRYVDLFRELGCNNISLLYHVNKEELRKRDVPDFHIEEIISAFAKCADISASNGYSFVENQMNEVKLSDFFEKTRLNIEDQSKYTFVLESLGYNNALLLYHFIEQDLSQFSCPFLHLKEIAYAINNFINISSSREDSSIKIDHNVQELSDFFKKTRFSNNFRVKYAILLESLGCSNVSMLIHLNAQDLEKLSLPSPHRKEIISTIERFVVVSPSKEISLFKSGEKEEKISDFFKRTRLTPDLQAKYVMLLSSSGCNNTSLLYHLSEKKLEDLSVPLIHRKEIIWAKKNFIDMSSSNENQSVKKQRASRTMKKFDLFVAHAGNENGQPHELVQEIVNYLRTTYELNVWFQNSFESEEVIDDTLANSFLFVVFVSREYLTKINLGGESVLAERCNYEYTRSILSHRRRKTIVVIIDSDLLTLDNWFGPAKDYLGRMPYINYSNSSKLVSASSKIISQIDSKLTEDMQSHPLEDVNDIKAEALALFNRNWNYDAEKLALRAYDMNLKAQNGNRNHMDIVNDIVLLGNIYFNQEKYYFAELMYREAILIFKTLRQTDCVSYNECMHRLSYSLIRNRGCYIEDELLRQKVDVLRKNLAKNEHREIDETTDTIDRLACYLCKNGDYCGAEALYRESIFIRKTSIGDHDPRIASSLELLSELLIRTGNCFQAEITLETAFEIHRNLFGLCHQSTLVIATKLGYVKQFQGKYSEACSILEKIVEIKNQLSGTDHPDSVATLINYVILLSYKGEYVEAERKISKSLQTSQITLQNHPSVILRLSFLGSLLQVQRKFECAYLIHQKVLEARIQFLGNVHPDTIIARENLAGLFSDIGNFPAAEKLHIEVLELRKIYLGSDHPEVARSLHYLADLLIKQGKHSEAKQLLNEAVWIVKKSFGNLHPTVALLLSKLAKVLSLEDDNDGAISAIQEALNIQKQILGEEHQSFATSLYILAGFFKKKCEYDYAEVRYRNAIAIWRKCLPYPENLASALYELASVLKKKGNDSEAEALFREHLDISEKTIGHEQIIVID